MTTYSNEERYFRHWQLTSSGDGSAGYQISDEGELILSESFGLHKKFFCMTCVTTPQTLIGITIWHARLQ